MSNTLWLIFDSQGKHLTTCRGDNPEAIIEKLQQFRIVAKGYQAYTKPIICNACARAIDVESWSDWQIHRAITQPESPDVTCRAYPCVCVF